MSGLFSVREFVRHRDSLKSLSVPARRARRDVPTPHTEVLIPRWRDGVSRINQASPTAGWNHRHSQTTG